MRDRVRGADLIKDPDETPLMQAVTRGDSKAIESLIKGGADVNAKDQKGWTALMMAAGACWNDFPLALARWDDIVKRLLVAGADVNARNREGETPLMIAATCGDLQIVTSLIAEGADVNARTDKGCTALTYSAYSNSPSRRDRTMVILKKAGARW
jgi:ankyrin repeat protein